MHIWCNTYCVQALGGGCVTAVVVRSYIYQFTHHNQVIYYVSGVCMCGIVAVVFSTCY